MKAIIKTLLTLTLLTTVPAQALHIILTNDDSWHTENIQVLKDALVAAGHDVIMSAPCAPQSGKGGSMTFGRPVPIDTSKASAREYCVGDTDGDIPYANYAEGTPVVAALYGIDVLAQKAWQARPDLLISGPNEGNNLGIGNNNSGTLGATLIAIGKGVPALAVSAHHNSGEDPTQAPKIASIVLQVLGQLEASAEKGQPLLPLFTGINLNLPEDLDHHKGYKFTQVGWYSGFDIRFTDDLSSNAMMINVTAGRILKAGAAENLEQALVMARHKMKGLAGLSFDAGASPLDTDPDSEANAVAQGYITISTIDGSVQASAEKAERMRARLGKLGSWNEGY